MTIFEDVFRDLLISTNLCDSRVFLIRAPQVPAPQMTTPYMVFQNVGPMPLHTMLGPLDVIMREYQISIYDKSQSFALGIADALRGKIDGYRGPFEGISFDAIFYKAQTSSWQFDTELCVVIISFEILFRYAGILAATVNRNQRQQQRQYQRK